MLAFPSSSSILVAWIDKRVSAYGGCHTPSGSEGIRARTCSLWMESVSTYLWLLREQCEKHGVRALGYGTTWFLVSTGRKCSQTMTTKKPGARYTSTRRPAVRAPVIHFSGSSNTRWVAYCIPLPVGHPRKGNPRHGKGINWRPFIILPICIILRGSGVL